MKFVLRVVAALFLCATSVHAHADALDLDAVKAEQLSEAMKSARWTGPMLASNAETLPKGHFYTEPYFYDVIVGGEHYPGSSGFYQYGLRDDLTVGFQPSLSFGRGKVVGIGDLKLLGQLRLTHFTPQHRVPTVAIVLNATLPTGKHDRLRASEEGHGAGSFAPEVGVNVQHWFLLKNGRLLRARINLLKSFPQRAGVANRSVYGTADGFRGRARPGSKTTLIGAVEYSVTREWVLAFDIIRESTSGTTLQGRYGSGTVFKQRFPATRSVGFAPAVEYNWSDRSGVLLGVWISPKGHSTPRSITPALAYSRFW